MTLHGFSFALSAIGLLFSAAAQATTVSPADPNLQFIGRWDRSDQATPWCFAQGSAVIARFTGTSVAAAFDTSEGERFRIIIDGNARTSKKIEFFSGEFETLASGLEQGTHTIEVIKETDRGRANLLGLELDDGESTTPPPPRPARRMTFYGDSNLAGYSLDSERNRRGWHLVGTYYGYAGIASRQFGAEYHNISRSGATISSLNAAYDRVDWTTSSPAWDFSGDQSDVVVVNIGANNAGQSKDSNKVRYHALLDDLRQVHPAAHMVLFNSFGWDANEPANYIREVVGERGDANMSWAVFPWVFEQYHGCQTDHSGMAQYLVDHLEKITGWTAGPPDVVNGYGDDGDVANGSFEEAAPFGGWGWRYFNAAGVERIFDPTGARHGSYYLRIENGAASHQTNPSGNGDPVALSAWMRGTREGDTVEVAISFRDQDGGGEPNPPMMQISETMTLSTDWDRYRLRATAPDDHAPVFSVRVTFTAGSDSTVDIDRVSTGAGLAAPRRPSGRIGFNR